MTGRTLRKMADTVPPAAPRPPKRRGRHDRPSSLLTILLWTCGLYFILPLVWLALSSTKSTTQLFTTFGFSFGTAGRLWRNISTVFTEDDGIYLRWLVNTVVYAGVSAGVATLFCSMGGYAFAKYDFPFGKTLFNVTLGAVMIPMTALAIPTYLLFARVGLTNTPLAVVLPSMVSPFGIFLMRVYAADAVSDSLIEAARIDGAGELRIFWRVSFRMLMPGMITVFLFSLVATWNNYILPLIMLNSPKLYPITVGLAQELSAATSGGGAYTVQLSGVITGAFISVVPLVACFLYLQRYWQAGLSSGAVKD